MRAAPQNGTAVKVQHGPDQAVALARWSGQGQGWVRDDESGMPVLFSEAGGVQPVFIDDRENVLWTRHVECWSDDQVIEMARKEEGSHFGVQVWERWFQSSIGAFPRGLPTKQTGRSPSTRGG
jgi:hypothetical protein